MLNNFLNILFPEHCPICEKPSLDHKTTPICTDCWQTIRPYSGPKCQKCNKPHVSDIPTICGDCLNDEPAFKFAKSFGIYEGVLKKAINLLKYHNVKRLSKPLTDIILQIKIPRADSLIPVPLYKKRLRHREFNQSALLAKNIAKSLGVKVLLNCLVKIKDTMPQVGLSSRDRIKNIKKTFEVTNKKLIEGENIILVDDVFTTGATVRECSKVLKRAGAEDIYVITLAHGLRD